MPDAVRPVFPKSKQMCRWAGVLGVPRVRPSTPLNRFRFVISTILYNLLFELLRWTKNPRVLA